MTLWLPLPPPERNCSPRLEVCFFTLGTATPCHVNKARVFAWRFNTAINKSAPECLPTRDKGTHWGRYVIPGGAPLLYLPPSLSAFLHPLHHHMTLITTSSPKASLFNNRCLSPPIRPMYSRKAAWICAKSAPATTAGYLLSQFQQNFYHTWGVCSPICK